MPTPPPLHLVTRAPGEGFTSGIETRARALVAFIKRSFLLYSVSHDATGISSLVLLPRRRDSMLQCYRFLLVAVGFVIQRSGSGRGFFHGRILLSCSLPRATRNPIAFYVNLSGSRNRGILLPTALRLIFGRCKHEYAIHQIGGSISLTPT